MRIKLPALEFTGSSHSEHAAGLAIDGNRVVQDVKHFRATESSNEDRGNVSHTITFSVTRIHADEDAAESYILSHDAACEAAAGGLITLMTSAGGTIGTYNNGELADWSLVRQLGATTTWSYQLRAGGRT